MVQSDRVKQKTKLRFTWHLIAEGVREACEVQLLCHNAAGRGVHLPKAWKTNLNKPVVDVDALAHSAVLRVREELFLSDATKFDCRLPYTHTRHKHVCTPKQIHTKT